ncbi:cation:proton antiporter domain-containing protein [Saccharicrinis fermentans]|uniref:Inner membrane protein YbaL n=1 Tax=Saccharicrinis fermentans DSM 9555 = JCM 21142 TaxID=869213 RepID=W7Y4D9_9BACT|nr:cation:proton antiporter [Saccharicrinis fermentans]GAF05760.1 inner membrane protein YbaL [Saccharicrinis fermentans DSM 9555 = JCM 21142]
MEFPILSDIVVIFALSTVVNLVFTKLKIPTVVGYLLTGILAGPHLLALVHGEHEIEVLAEIGVVLLLFTIGLEFSLKHLLKIRKIVFLGGLLQVLVTAGIFYVISQFYDLSWQTSLFIGFLVALSSSALVLKILQERSELSSNYGRTILGVLIFQDLLLVPLLLFANLLGKNEVHIVHELLLLGLKAVFIILLVYVGNKWLLPKLLHIIAMTKNQELFMMSIFLICLAIALITSQLGMSLAFGAFLAGLMISESQYSHNAFSNLIPFKDTFTSFFFVSIGMLLDLRFVLDNYQLVIFIVVLVMGIKTVVAGGAGFMLGHTLRGTVLVGLALSQVGEFSFILAKIGLNNAIIDDYFYQLFLAVAVITMSFTPFLMNVSRPLANALLKLPLPDFLINGLFPLKEIEIPDINNHLVIIGTDTSALKLSLMAKLNNLHHVSVIFDPILAKEKMDKGDLVVYGDAVNEPILKKAHVDTAEIVLISVGRLIPSMAIIEKVRGLNKKAYIIARSKYIQNMEQLYMLGADQVLPEKLEIAIDLFNRILVKKLYPQKEVNRILTHIRNLNLGEFSERDIVNQPSIFDELMHMNISAIKIEVDSPVDGKSLSDIQLRSKTGVTLLAIKRGTAIIEHPAPDTILRYNDIVYVLGDPEQTNWAFELFDKELCE